MNRHPDATSILLLGIASFLALAAIAALGGRTFLETNGGQPQTTQGLVTQLNRGVDTMTLAVGDKDYVFQGDDGATITVGADKYVLKDKSVLPDNLEVGDMVEVELSPLGNVRRIEEIERDE